MVEGSRGVRIRRGRREVWTMRGSRDSESDGV